MVDPDTLTKYNRTTEELEELIIFSIAVAGKTAYTINKSVDFFLSLEKGNSPFDKIRKMIKKNTLIPNLKKAKLGKYKLLTKAFHELVTFKLDLKTCSVHQLESFQGIGPKTARMFLLHSRKNQRFAVLDVHILEWMRENKIAGDIHVPKMTPSSKKYAILEEAFLTYCDKNKLSPANLDLSVWKSRRKKINKT